MYVKNACKIKKDKEDDLISQFTDQKQTVLITFRQFHAAQYHPNLGFCHKKSLSHRVNNFPNNKHAFSEKKINLEFHIAVFSIFLTF